MYIYSRFSNRVGRSRGCAGRLRATRLTTRPGSTRPSRCVGPLCRMVQALPSETDDPPARWRCSLRRPTSPSRRGLPTAARRAVCTASRRRRSGVETAQRAAQCVPCVPAGFCRTRPRSRRSPGGYPSSSKRFGWRAARRCSERRSRGRRGAPSLTGHERCAPVTRGLQRLLAAGAAVNERDREGYAPAASSFCEVE